MSELEELKKRNARLELLYQVGSVIHSTLEPQPALALLVRETARLMSASSCSVALLNPTTGFLEIQASEGLPAQAESLRLRPGEGITGWVAQTGQPARVGDVTKDKRYIMLRATVRSELAVPLAVKGRVGGVLNVDADRLDAFTAEDQTLLEALAEQAAHVIHNTWLYEQSRLKARLLESLANVSRTMNSALNLDEVLQTITRDARTLVRAKMCSLMMLDATHQWLNLRASDGAGEVYRSKPPLSVAESLLGTVVRRRRAIQVDNVQTSAGYQNVEVARREGLVSLLSVPLMFSGEALGTLNVYTASPYKFSNEEIRILTAFAELSAIAIEKARLYERLVDAEEQMRQNEKLSALGLLAAEVAHEIRNPLTVMKMLYHSLDLQFPPGDPRGEDARLMGEKIEHLNKIVERILDFARTTEPDLRPVNLNALIEELLLLVRHKLANQGVALVRQLDPDLPEVAGDALQLEQAFLNLILNAAEAMPAGGTLTLATRSLPTADPAQRRVTVEFADTGEGMNEEQCSRAFRSVLNTTKAKGTGLGLAIVGRTVETHGGQLDVSSQRGQGTTIRLHFPPLAG
jgi:signal transduction histidine kinase